MAFVKFETPGMRQGEPKVAIWKRGQININKSAVEQFKLQKFNYCILYYDPDDNKIGIKFTNDGNDVGAMKIMKKKDGSRLFSGISFFKHFNINYGDTKNYLPEYNESDNMIVFNLADGK